MRRSSFEAVRDKQLSHTLNGKPHDGQHRSCTDKVVAPPHAKHAAPDAGKSKMIYTGGARVECHGDGRDELGDEDDDNRLPPVKTDADHGLQNQYTIEIKA